MCADLEATKESGGTKKGEGEQVQNSKKPCYCPKKKLGVLRMDQFASVFKKLVDKKSKGLELKCFTHSHGV